MDDWSTLERRRFRTDAFFSDAFDTLFWYGAHTGGVKNECCSVDGFIVMSRSVVTEKVCRVPQVGVI